MQWTANKHKCISANSIKHCFCRQRVRGLLRNEKRFPNLSSGIYIEHFEFQVSGNFLFCWKQRTSQLKIDVLKWVFVILGINNKKQSMTKGKKMSRIKRRPWKPEFCSDQQKSLMMMMVMTLMMMITVWELCPHWAAQWPAWRVAADLARIARCICRQYARHPALCLWLLRPLQRTLRWRNLGPAPPRPRQMGGPGAGGCSCAILELTSIFLGIHWSGVEQRFSRTQCVTSGYCMLDTHF